MLPVGIPVRGAIQAGNWLDTTLIDEAYEEPEVLPIAADPRFQYAQQYAMEVRGDSMNREFADGSFVICVDFAQSGLEMKDDMIVHVERWRHNLREITLKVLKRDASGWRLEPRSTNEAHKPIVMNGRPDDDTEVRVRGVVIGDYRRRTV
jgi:SOS-response transcriptional repressor LexA